MKKKYLKIIGAIIATIILGAIGSGVWERVLSPLLGVCVDLIISFFSWVSITFKDSLYSDAAQGFHEKHSLTLLNFIYGLIAGFFIALMLSVKIMSRIIERIKGREEELPSESSPYPPRWKYIPYFIALTIFTFGVFLSAQETYINKITTWSLTSIERVRGKISEKDYGELRSKFFSVENAKDYNKFHSLIIKRADQYGIKLRVFRPM